MISNLRINATKYMSHYNIIRPLLAYYWTVSELFCNIHYIF